MTNERMPDFQHPSDAPGASSFPTVQAPSTRARSPAGSIDDAELEAKFRKTLLDNSDDEDDMDEAELELRHLADKLARVRSGNRPDTLRRHGTV